MHNVLFGLILVARGHVITRELPRHGLHPDDDIRPVSFAERHGIRDPILVNVQDDFGL